MFSCLNKFLLSTTVHNTNLKSSFTKINKPFKGPTLKHSNKENGNVMTTSRNERNVTHLSMHPTESGLAVTNKKNSNYTFSFN